MPTRIVFLSGQETVVNDTEDEVVMAVRRDHPNPVKLEGEDGVVQFVNWTHVTLVKPEPAS